MKYYYRGYADTEYREITAECLNEINEKECGYANTCIVLTEIVGNKMYFDYFEGNE